MKGWAGSLLWPCQRPPQIDSYAHVHLQENRVKGSIQSKGAKAKGAEPESTKLRSGIGGYKQEGLLGPWWREVSTLVVSDAYAHENHH